MILVCYANKSGVPVLFKGTYLKLYCRFTLDYWAAREYDNTYPKL